MLHVVSAKCLGNESRVITFNLSVEVPDLLETAYFTSYLNIVKETKVMNNLTLNTDLYLLTVD